MVIMFMVLMDWSSPTQAPVISGEATFYAPGVMATVARNRGVSLDGRVGGVALNRKGDLGRDVWLEVNGRMYGPFLVIDCAQQGHYKDRERLGRVVEVSGRQARKWGMRGPIKVKVWFEPQSVRRMERCRHQQR